MVLKDQVVFLFAPLCDCGEEQDISGERPNKEPQTLQTTLENPTLPCHI